MYGALGRQFWLLITCACLAACSAAPTSPSTVSPGPAQSQNPLVPLIPEGPPPVPERIAGPMPTALGATRFVSFGDSITYGTLSSYDGSFDYDVPTWAYSVRLKLALDQFHPGQPCQTPRTYIVENAGVPGENAREGAQRIQMVIDQSHPQGLLLLEGINDLGGGLGVTSAVNSLRSIIETARSPRNNVTVLVATMFQTYDTCNPTTGQCRDNGKDLIVPFNQALRQMAAGRQNVYVVDLYAAFGTDHRFVGADGLHPNEEGYARVASTFLAEIERVFGIAARSNSQRPIQSDRAVSSS